METLSKHGLLDLWIKNDFQNSLARLKSYLHDRFGVAQEISHESEKSSVAMGISESLSFSLKSFPQSSHFQLDIHSGRDDLNLTEVFDEIKALVPVRKSHSAIFRRGDSAQRQITRSQTDTQSISQRPLWAPSKDLPLS